ncbi:hypothetical protein C0J52_05355 [Blattella germanica]|nr:hypothetical protein C0J52_05355 [Blattella germanica]
MGYLIISCVNENIRHFSNLSTDFFFCRVSQKCECDNSSPLHMTCGLPNSGPFLHKLCSSNGCDINRLFANSQASLQLLLTGDLQGNWSSVIEAVKLLVTVHKERRNGTCRERHFLLSMTDPEGNTPLLIAGRRLLREGAFDRAAQLSRLLLEAGSDPNAANAEGRSLLTYSVHYMDESIELTRVLLNGGATVWPIGSHDSMNSQTIENVSNTEQCSAFTWFLRSVIRRRKLDEQCEQTLALLTQVMGEHPGRMHGHVMRTMFRHAKCYKVLGPVFYQLKISMMRYWTQPPDLLFMCRKAIRSAVGPERLMSGDANKLGLPSQIQGYLMLE